MWKYDPVIDKERNVFVVSRAATGIYLILKQLNILEKRFRVLVPANICYAAVFPILYAGYEPLFCDVDPVSGNVTYKEFTGVCNQDVAAAIVPHMYGNPVIELLEIAAYCRKQHITLIEDCASAMGAETDNYRLGELGDYTIYSTGYAKTLDLGFGGMISSENDLSQIATMEDALNELTQVGIDNLLFWGKLYRLMRNEGSNSLIEHEIGKIIPSQCKWGLICRLSQERKDYIYERLISRSFVDVIKNRRTSLKMYQKRVAIKSEAVYPYAQGAVPWRFNMLVNPEKKKYLIKTLLEQNLPVSDWYPRVTPLLQIEDELPGALWHEQHIVNFPLLCSTEKTDAICNAINKIL